MKRGVGLLILLITFSLGACGSDDKPFIDVISDCGGRGEGRQEFARLQTIATGIEEGVQSAVEYVNEERDADRWPSRASQKVIRSLQSLGRSASELGRLEPPTPANADQVTDALDELYEDIRAEWTEVVTSGVALLRRSRDGVEGDSKKMLVGNFRQSLNPHSQVAKNVNELTSILEPACM